MFAVIFSVLILCIAAAVFGKAPEDAVLVFDKGEGGYYCHKIPYLYRSMTGTLIAMAEGRGKNGRDACDDFSGTDLVFKRSFDDGKTWSPLGLVWSNSTEEETNVIGNAGIVQDSSTGRIWIPLCRNNEEVYLLYSDDDGESWSPPVYQPQLVHDDWKWVGLGPPSGLQLSSGRLLVPSYHTTLYKGDGCVSKGHTIYSDDHGVTWLIGSDSFGAPYFSNECQAVELKNGSVLVNARTISTHRIQILSNDGGLTFEVPMRMTDLVETVEGCEGSIARDASANILYYSGAFNDGLIRRNMTVLRSLDEGLSWSPFIAVDRGAVAYSAMQILYPSSAQQLQHSQQLKKGLSRSVASRDAARISSSTGTSSVLGLLYERSDNISLIFEPDQILFVAYKI